MAVEQLLAGKKAELFVFSELLKRGVLPYIPLVDAEGIDAIIKTPDNEHLELQIKSVQTERDPRWFQVNKLEPNFRKFIICIEPNFTAWIIPSLAFAKYATVSKKIYDLSLDAALQGTTKKRKDIFVRFKDNWDLLSRPMEDIGDLLAMYDSLMAPEEEAMSWEEYKRQRAAGVRNTK
ncbi:MAG: hypothetical protein EXR50_01905 [Dehalococcoidia bacterium]|nr:hypothetical protein [Dehalococcoidia bacterium]